jgi:poly-gamma-glutamate synthase PgsB/CapB
MRTLLPCLILFLLYLIGERLALERCLRRIPMRIAITGTRGKTSVTRLLASILQEDGRRVIAKTTGSEAVILLPDGGRIELNRDVTPSILEQKQLVKKAVKLHADCLIAEVMSLRPENHYIESRRILQPNIVAITNVRRDHTEIMGETKERIASVLSLDICAGAAVFLPEEEDCPSFRAEAERAGASLFRVKPGASAPLMASTPQLSPLEFSENLDLVYAVADHIGVSQTRIREGIRKARHDMGRLRVWRYKPHDSQRTCYLVNAFAANDPESTLEVLSRVTGMLPHAAGNIVGILNLRADRAPRTLQWISALREGAGRRFAQLFVIGAHTRIVRRQLPQARVLKSGSAEEMLNAVCSASPDAAVVFGFGNIKGAGMILAKHWAEVGEPYGI